MLCAVEMVSGENGATRSQTHSALHNIYGLKRRSRKKIWKNKHRISISNIKLPAATADAAPAATTIKKKETKEIFSDAESY